MFSAFQYFSFQLFLKNVHLVFLNQYYPPDAAPTGVMLEGLVEELVRNGHEVTVICASGGYAENRTSNIERPTSNVESGEADRVPPLLNQPFIPAMPQGDAGSTLNHLSRQSPEATPDQPSTSAPRIIRLRASRFGRGTFAGKLLDYASYYVGVAWKLLTLHPKPDRIVALTTPPLLSVLARLISKIRGADHAHWVMDLYPDVMAAHGMLGDKSAIYRILAGLARWGFGGRRCAAVLTLGPDMAERCERLVSGPFPVVGGRSVIRSQPSTLNSQLASNSQLPTSSVQWVPLWGSEVPSDQSSECGVSVSELGVAGEAAILHGRRQIREEEVCSGVSATVAVVADNSVDVNARAPSSSSSIHPSTINHSPSTSSLRRKRGWADGELIVMYSGNMGLGHRFGEILAAAKRVNSEHRTPDIEHRSEAVADAMDSSLSGINESRDLASSIDFARMNESRGPKMPAASSNPLSRQSPEATPDQLSSPIRFVFFGGGKRRVEVETFVKENRGGAVEVRGYAPAEELAAHLQSADVHLASLDAAWTGTMVPSKLQGIFAAGRPVIFIGSADSSIGRWVAESGGGWLVHPGDVDGLLAALDEARDPETRLPRGRAARDFADKHFDKRTNVARVAAILIGRRDVSSLHALE